MNRPLQAHWWLAVGALACLSGFPLRAQEGAAPPPQKIFSPTATNAMPPMPLPPPAPPHSPVDFFRQLLALSPRELHAVLSNRPPEFRTNLLAKVREYQALGPDERELRLRATELRWYLMPFFHEPATNHAARLAQVPDDLRELVKSRVVEWDALSPQLQQEFLANEPALHYFTHVDPAGNPPPLPAGLSQHPVPSDEDQIRWNALSPDARGKITAQFSQFFDLTPAEKQKTLGTLSTAERRQMEKTLQSFDSLPPAQRRECVRAYGKFAGMSPPERSEFLKNAERWSAMSPAERQTWRDLVKHVPQWPPLPTTVIMPPMPIKPPPLAPHTRPLMATNDN